MSFMPGQIVFEGELTASSSHSLSHSQTHPRAHTAMYLLLPIICAVKLEIRSSVFRGSLKSSRLQRWRDAPAKNRPVALNKEKRACSLWNYKRQENKHFNSGWSLPGLLKLLTDLRWRWHPHRGSLLKIRGETRLEFLLHILWMSTMSKCPCVWICASCCLS